MLIVGAICFGMARAKTLEIRRMPSVETRSTSPFESSKVGQTVVLRGTIASEKDDIEIYQAELKKVRKEARGKDFGDVRIRVEWDIEEIHSPAFRLKLDDGAVPIVNRTYRLDEPHLLEEDDSLRFRGFAPGDTALVIGTTTHEGIIATTVSGASLSTYLRSQNALRESYQTWGSLGIGLSIPFAGLALLGRHQRNRREST